MLLPTAPGSSSGCPRWGFDTFISAIWRHRRLRQGQAEADKLAGQAKRKRVALGELFIDGYAEANCPGWMRGGLLSS